jgi:LCP family protein required for cell wall assembly
MRRIALMLRLPGGKPFAGKAGFGLSCVLAAVVLVVSAVGHFAQQAAERVGSSRVLAGGKSTGPMTILIMGLESRTYWDGTTIDHHLQYVMHVGSAGGNATNTLILLHVFAGGQKAVAFSIPRDDYVQMVGTNGYGPHMNKVDAAYNGGMQARMIADRKLHPTWTAKQLNLDGNEGGRLAAVETVQALTGVKIDKFAELNLVGFYELAAAFGGVDVCVNAWPGGDGIPANGNLRDPIVYYPRTGWQGSGSVVRPGYQHLTPEQALAFVRNRHNLPGGDIARTSRQLAVLDYVLWKLRNEGALTDVSKLRTLMGVAQNFLAVPAGWNLLEFAGEMNALTGHNLTMGTLPSSPGPNISLIGDVNNVDVAKIQAKVQQAFSTPPGSGTSLDGPGKGAGPPASGTSPTKAIPRQAAPAPPASSVTVDADNASGHSGLARDVLKDLHAKGYRKGTAQTVTPLQSLTTVSYGAGARANAVIVAKFFGASTTVAASSSVPAGHVLVTMGVATLQVPASLSGPQPATSSSPSASSTPAGGATSGSSVTVAPNARYGVPCVY